MMTSTSSNGSEYEMQYSGLRTIDRLPWYPTLRQPLIYYAQLQPECCRQRNKDGRKNTPNCFAKAFRWYTQEHAPFNPMVGNKVNKTDIKDFASWLDDKYNEYLQNNHTDVKQNILNRTSTQIILNDTKQHKRRSRIKSFSPWKKRKGSKENGDDVLKSNQSIEVILKPKKLSCPASEYCQRTIKAQSCNNFNSTTQSDTSALEKKWKPKSRSLTSVLKEREIYVFEHDFVPQRPTNYDIKPDADVRPSKLFKRRKYNSVIHKKHKTSNVLCQCSNMKVSTADASSQFEKKSSRSNICLCELTEATTLRKDSTVIRWVIKEKPIALDGKNKTGSSTLNDSVQTSEFSISLEDEIKLPIFMKIICAD